MPDKGCDGHSQQHVHRIVRLFVCLLREALGRWKEVNETSCAFQDSTYGQGVD